MNGVIEFVFSGSRFKLWIPSQSIVVFFSLAGVQTSRAPEGDKKGTSEEAKWGNMVSTITELLQAIPESSVTLGIRKAQFIGAESSNAFGPHQLCDSNAFSISTSVLFLRK